MEKLFYTFKDKGGTLYCYDTYSNSVFEIDELMKSIIEGDSKEKLLESWDNDKIDAAIRNYKAWQERGFFVEYDMQDTISNSYDFEHVNLISTSLMVSNDCNMRCIYCFNDGGTKPVDADKVMTYDIAKQAIDFLVNNSTRNEVGCDFFGGEPLFNFRLIKQIVEYCKQYTDKKWIFSLITNGSVLNEEMIDFFVQNKFHIVVSYDGVLQNKQRPGQGGRNFVPTIRENVKKLVSVLPRSEISIRCILTHEMCAHIEEIITEAQELGVRVLFGPVTLENPNPLNLSDEDYNTYIRVIEEEIRKNYDNEKFDLVTGITSLSGIILQLITGKKKYYSCGIGTDQVGISATGIIYPCHRFIGMKDFEMGNIFSGIDCNQYKGFTERYVDNIPKCKSCWAKYLCGGGCAHEAYTYNNNLFSPCEERCDLTRKEIEIALKIYADAIKKGEQFKLEKIAKMLDNNITTTKEHK